MNITKEYFEDAIESLHRRYIQLHNYQRGTEERVEFMRLLHSLEDALDISSGVGGNSEMPSFKEGKRENIEFATAVFPMIYRVQMAASIHLKVPIKKLVKVE